MRWQDVFQDSRQAVRTIVTSVLRQFGDAGERWQRTSFNASNQVRAILFRECERRGRKLLFDSKTVHKRENGSKSDVQPTASSLVVENGVSYEYSKPSSDIKMLGEMIFGSVAMSFQGETLKVHTIRSPPQVMVSLLFPAPVTRNRQDLEGSGCFESSFGSESSAPGPSSCVAHSVPMDVPGFCDNESASELLDSLEQWSADSSLTHSNSYNSFHRRYLNSMSTSIEYGLGSRTDTNGSLVEDTPGVRKIKLGLGVLIAFPEEDPDEEFQRFQDFFFSHVALVESHVQRLSMVCQQSFVQKHFFVGSILEGVQQLKGALQNLYCTPRLPRPPAWLALVGPNRSNHSPTREISTQLLYLIKHFDTKNTNFFVSTVLTAVLSSHLSWVSTVAPSSGSAQKSCPRGSQHYVRRESAQWLDDFAQSHPYNPLWVQLGDLFGAVGCPPKLCRVLVTGRSSDVILRFLYTLSYFIRCSDVSEKLANQIESLDISEMSPLPIPKKIVPVKMEVAKRVVFQLGDSPHLSPIHSSLPELPRTDSPETHCQTDTSLGYSSLPDVTECRSREESNSLGDCGCVRQVKRRSCSQDTRTCTDDYNGLAFETDPTEECVQSRTLDSEDTEDGYHSMEDCPVQSCYSCTQNVMVELDMPRAQVEEKGKSGGLGVSLLAGISSRFSPDFCLQGLLSKRGHELTIESIMQDLIAYSQTSVLGEAQAVTVLADTNTWQVHKILTGLSTSEKTSVSMSPLVAGICDSLLQMDQLSMSPEFCLMHLEDRLQELYFRSQSLAVFLSERPTLNVEQTASHLGLHTSDIPLLISVASTMGQQL